MNAFDYFFLSVQYIVLNVSIKFMYAFMLFFSAICYFNRDTFDPGDLRLLVIFIVSSAVAFVLYSVFHKKPKEEFEDRYIVSRADGFFSIAICIFFTAAFFKITPIVITLYEGYSTVVYVLACSWVLLVVASIPDNLIDSLPENDSLKNGILKHAFIDMLVFLGFAVASAILLYLALTGSYFLRVLFCPLIILHLRALIACDYRYAIRGTELEKSRLLNDDGGLFPINR